MSDPISAASTAVSGIRAVSELVKGLKEKGIRAEFETRILDLHASILDLQLSTQELREENTSLRDALSLRNLRFADGMYWDGDDGPFCPSCVDGGQVRARVSQNPSNGYWVCNVCDKSPIGARQPPGPSFGDDSLPELPGF